MLEFKGLADAAEKRTSHYQTLYTFNLQSFTYARRYNVTRGYIYLVCVWLCYTGMPILFHTHIHIGSSGAKKP